jgi:hypothetical protein
VERTREKFVIGGLEFALKDGEHLLAEHLVKVGIIDSISDATIGQTLKEMKLNRG